MNVAHTYTHIQAKNIGGNFKLSIHIIWENEIIDVFYCYFFFRVYFILHIIDYLKLFFHKLDAKCGLFSRGDSKVKITYVSLSVHF